MVPNCPAGEFHSSQAEFQRLLERIGKSQRWVAERTGMSERRLRYLLAGGRLVSAEFVATEMSYIEFFALACLAEAAEIMREN